MRAWLTACVLSTALAACGGSGDTPAANRAPTPRIVAPAAGTLFSAGQSLTVAVDGSDAEDGTLAASRLSWWIELHHDTHVHPFQAEATGAGGTLSIPARGETSDNIFYRLHVRATDSAGLSTEVTRDVLPRKSRVTLNSTPPGLALTLDGQAFTGGGAFTGVVGAERDLGAAEQVVGARRYRFASWSDGGAASHTLITPAADTTLTATFVDAGPAVNLPPVVSLSAPGTATTGVVATLTALASDSDGSIARVAFFDGSTALGELTPAPYALA